MSLGWVILPGFGSAVAGTSDWKSGIAKFLMNLNETATGSARKRHWKLFLLQYVKFTLSDDSDDDEDDDDDDYDVAPCMHIQFKGSWMKEPYVTRWFV